MRSRLRSHDGANAVEFAFVLPILVLLLFGIFTVGMAYNTKLVANHAARDAARFGATLPFVDDGGLMGEQWFVDVRDRAIEAGEGEFGSVSGGVREDAVICVAYNNDPDWRSYTWTGSTPTGPASTACYSDSLSGERVQVRLQRDASFDIALLPPRTLTLTSDAVARFEDRQLPPAPSPSPPSS